MKPLTCLLGATLFLLAAALPAHDLSLEAPVATSNVVATYFVEGVGHILTGWDHLCFLLALLLGGGSWKRWFLLASVFTLAHSLTLSLAVLGFVPPLPWIEPLIALSIVVVAVGNLTLRDRDFGLGWAAGFGLLHGLGFAGALAEVGVPADAVGWALVSFNVGVEVGQMAAVGAVGGLLVLLSRTKPQWTKLATTGGSFSVALLGATWFALPLLIAAADPKVSADQAVARAAKTFAPYASTVKTRSDGQYFYVESRGMPDHSMLVGITEWIEQVPLPQNYTGTNAWQFPLQPVAAAHPLSAKDHFFRGAIAIAANGVPIFNPIKADGKTDAWLNGELDEFGGHAGKADDYHYHISPLFLSAQLGPSVPLAWALDGYPIYGLTEADGSAVTGLDAFNGHSDPVLGYHYHSSKTYPYLNGGFHGEVVERQGQVEPQPRSEPLRSESQLALGNARGARVTGFSKPAANRYVVEYTVDGKKGTIDYTLFADGKATFVYTDKNGKVKTETYTPGESKQGGPGTPPTPPSAPQGGKK